MRRRLLAALAIAAIAVVAGAASPAFAHNYLVSASPAPGSTVTKQPGTLTVTTNSTLLNSQNGAGFAMLVQDADGNYYGDGCVTISGASMSTDAQLGPAGTYTVTWQVVSTDAHPVSATYIFNWKPTSSQKLATGTTTVPNCQGTIRATTPDDAATASTNTTVWWIVGGVAVVVIAIVVTLLILRPRSRQE